MDREGEDGVVLTDDRRGAVSLVNIAIDNDQPSNPALLLDDPRGDDRVVEHAEALTMICIRMMGPAGQVNRHTFCQRRPASTNCPANRSSRSLNQFHRPGKTDAPHFFFAQPTCFYAFQIPLVVSQEDLFVSCGIGYHQILWIDDPLQHKAFTKSPVLFNGKPVASGQRKSEEIAVKGLHGKNHGKIDAAKASSLSRSSSSSHCSITLWTPASSNAAN